MIALDSYWFAPFLIGGSVLIGVLGLLITRGVFRSRFRLPHDVASALLSVVSTLYAVLLGLIVVDSIANFEQARFTTEQEAISLGDLLLFSRQLPEPTHTTMNRLADEYIQRVEQLEWPAMAHGKFAIEARQSALELADLIARFEPKSPREEALHAKLLDALGDFWNSRRMRLATSTHRVPTLQWIVVISGGLITIWFTYGFDVERIRLQVLMTALVTLIISLNVYLLFLFGEPFRGQLQVNPETFRRQIAAARGALTPGEEAQAPLPSTAP
jgi:hypothetical protein